MQDQSGFVDIIWKGKDGVYSPVYSLNYDWGTPAARQWNGNDDANVLWGEADVPGQDATVRMTLAVGQYWPNTRKTMANVMAAGPQGHGWDGAAMVLYSQICNWYLNCEGPNWYCSRADLSGMSWPLLKQKYEQELAEMVDVGHCGGERWRCFVASDVFTPGRNGMIEELKAIKQSVIASRPGMVKLIDYHTITT